MCWRELCWEETLGKVFADAWWDCRKLARRLQVRIRFVMG